MLWISAAGAETFEDLEGKSIVYDYHERNSYESGNLADVVWDGNGFTRSWEDGGVQTTEVVSVQGGHCKAFVERNPFTGTMLRHSGSCRILSGNAIKR